MKPTGREAVVKNRLEGNWSLLPDVWRGSDILRLTEPGQLYSVLLIRKPGELEAEGWYINVEEPFCRTSRGFDYLDQFLDVVFSADRREWRRKDEDEFEEAVAVGLIDRDKASLLRDAANHAVESVAAAQPPYGDEWLRWSPNPEWGLPVLSRDWDRELATG